MTGNTIHVELDIDLDRHLAGEPIYGGGGDIIGSDKTTLESVVIAEVVRTVVGRIVKDEMYRSLSDRIRTLRDEAIMRHVEPLVVAALERGIQPTNRLGESAGERVTLAERVIAEATDYLTKPQRDGRNYDAPQRTPAQKWIAEAVEGTVKRELQQALDEGKAEVKAALRRQGADILADTIAKMAVAS